MNVEQDTKRTMIHDGKTEIPSEIMSALNLQEGQQIAWHISPTGAVIIRFKNRNIDDIEGILPPPKQAVKIEDMRV